MRRRWGNIYLSTIILVSLILLAYIGYWYLFPKDRIRDQKYNFEFSNTQGWYKSDPKDGAYIVLVTAKNNVVVSNINLSIVSINELNRTTEANSESFCKGINKQLNIIADNIKFERVNINNWSGYKCYFEANGINTQSVLANIQYTITSGPNLKYIYVLGGSYPKGDIDETHKFEQLVQGFKIL